MTTLIEEEPYAAVVNEKFLAETCSRCFTRSDGVTGLMRCAACNVIYYCSKECQKADWDDHHKIECKYLKGAEDVPTEHIRLVMRMIFKSKTDPDVEAFNGRTYDSLMHHFGNYGKAPHSMENFESIHDVVSEILGCEVFDFETVAIAAAKMEINGIKIYDSRPAVCGSGVYLGLSVHDHSCRPDAFVICDGGKLVLRTTAENCVYSDKLTVSYASGRFFQNTLRRQKFLKTNYFFSCDCEECKDVGKNRKRLSGRPVCCPTGYFTPPHNTCSVCKEKVSASRVRKTKKALRDVTEALDGYDCNEHFLDLLDVARKVLVNAWIQLFNTAKNVLSDHNALLFALAEIIYLKSEVDDPDSTVKFMDICLPQMRDHPCPFTRAFFLARRHAMYELTGKSIPELKKAIDEALGTVEEVYGKEHKITLKLKEKKLQYDMALVGIQ